jgi:hypothetical protein
MAVSIRTITFAALVTLAFSNAVVARTSIVIVKPVNIEAPVFL